MNTQNLCTLQVFQLLSRKCKSHFLQSCPEEFIRFLCECLVNLLKGNLETIKRHHLVKFQNEDRLLLLKRTTWKQRRKILSSERDCNYWASLHFPSLTICLDMGQFVLVPASVYNKSVTTQSFTLLQRRNFQSIKPNNLPRTKLIL